MKAFMIRNVNTGEWFVKSKNSWTPKWERGTLWQHKSGPIQTMRHHHLDATVAEIVTFELKEEE